MLIVLQEFIDKHSDVSAEKTVKLLAIEIICRRYKKDLQNVAQLIADNTDSLVYDTDKMELFPLKMDILAKGDYL